MNGKERRYTAVGAPSTAIRSSPGRGIHTNVRMLRLTSNKMKEKAKEIQSTTWTCSHFQSFTVLYTSAVTLSLAINNI